jgi:hypothetical protein
VPGDKRIVPRCLKGVAHYVSATGHYYPCCWAANATVVGGSLFELHQDQLDLTRRSLEQVLASDVLRELAASWERFEDAPRACQSHCGVTTDPDGATSPAFAQPHRENIKLKKRR